MEKKDRSVWFKNWGSFANEFNVVRAIAFFAIGFMIMFGFYIHFHGETSPGGGFQSGIIMAMTFIIHDAVLICMANDKIPNTFISTSFATVCSALGVLIYSGTGLFCMLHGGALFDYRAISTHDPLSAQTYGLMFIELGVAITVFGSMSLVYNSLRNRFCIFRSTEKYGINNDNKTEADIKNPIKTSKK